jgi:hypothetical protein
MEKRFMKDFDEKAYIHANYPKYRELGLNSWDEVGEYLKKNPPYPKMDGEMLKKAENLMLTPAPLPKQDPADAPYHFCALASLCDDGPRAPEEG